MAPLLTGSRWVGQLALWVGRVARALLAPPRLRGPGRPLLKTAVRGGVLALTQTDLALGAGFLGSRLLWRVELAEVAGLQMTPPAAPGRGGQITIALRDGMTLTLDGVSPLAARRLAHLLAALRPPDIRDQ